MICNLTMVGRLGKDPEIRTTANGKQVCNFSVASSQKTPNGQEQTTWVRVVAFGKLAETCNQYLKKGELHYFAGRLSVSEYDDRDGNRKTSVEMILNEMKMLPGNRGAEPQDDRPVGRQYPPEPEELNDDIPF